MISTKNLIYVTTSRSNEVLTIRSTSYIVLKMDGPGSITASIKKSGNPQTIVITETNPTAYIDLTGEVSLEVSGFTHIGIQQLVIFRGC